MKNFKKIASAIAALSLAACVAVPMSATVFTASAADTTTSTIDKASTDNSITIEDNVTGHEYKAYQIFAGNLEKTDTDGTVTYGALTEIEWGEGITETPAGKDNIYTALANIQLADSSKPFTKDGAALNSAKAVADVLSGEAKTTLSDGEIAKAFAKAIAPYLNDTNAKGFSAVSGEGDAITGYKADKLKTGYYLVQQTGTVTDDAFTRFILKVAGNETAKPKKEIPTVDKQVSDNDLDDATGDTTTNKNKSTELDNGNGWFETADHAIGETFQFKLIAQLPVSKEFDEYDEYTLQFNDNWDEGIDYAANGKLVVTVPATSSSTGTETTYTFAKTASEDVTAWESNVEVKTSPDSGDYKLQVKIKDLKTLLGSNAKSLSGVKVEFIYDAKLNAKAKATNANVDAASGGAYNKGTAVNDNTVDLWYSHNPNSTGSGDFDTDHGKTTEDTVGVFTYEVDNAKVDQDNQPLAGAGFRLYSDERCSNEVYLKYDESNKVYLPTDESSKEEMKSTLNDTSDKAIFNIKGLDAGTYYLKETTTPAGYNELATPVKIEIKAVHSENNDGSGASVDLFNAKGKSTYNENKTDISALAGEITNQKGASLPSAGGIGTTLFYLGGGALVAVAGVMLITKKRMTKD